MLFETILRDLSVMFGMFWNHVFIPPKKQPEAAHFKDLKSVFNKKIGTHPLRAGSVES